MLMAYGLDIAGGTWGVYLTTVIGICRQHPKIRVWFFFTSILQRHTLRRDVARRKVMELFERDEFQKGD